MKDINCFLPLDYTHRFPSTMELFCMSLKNTMFPLVYIFDIVKDSLQLSMLITAVGFTTMINYCTSFSSVVSMRKQNCIKYVPSKLLTLLLQSLTIAIVFELIYYTNGHF